MARAVTRYGAARPELAPATPVAVSVRPAVPVLPRPPDGTAGKGRVVSNPVVRATEGALRILGAETRDVAAALLDAAPADLTASECTAVLAHFTFAEQADYERDGPGIGAPLPPDVGGYSLGGRRWINVNRQPDPK